MKLKGLNICSFDPYDDFGLPKGTRYRQMNNPFISFAKTTTIVTIGGTGTNTDFDGKVWAGKVTGLTVGGTIQSVGVDIVTAAGNIRVAVYQDDGASGNPSTLLGQSSSVAASGTGFQDVTVSATVPASGNIWIAFQQDSASCKMNFAATDVDVAMTQAYGTFPSPFGSVTTGLGFNIHLRVTYLH